MSERTEILLAKAWLAGFVNGVLVVVGILLAVNFGPALT